MHSFSQHFAANQRQSQQPSLSPAMQRALHLLGMAQDELEREVADICDGNPLISQPPLWQRRRVGVSDWRDQLVSIPARQHLSEHLMGQLALLGLEQTRLDLAHAIIERLDPAGYLDAEDWRALSEECPDAEETLRLVQELEPAGIAARSVSECFWLQLDVMERSQAIWRSLLSHLGDLTSCASSEFARRCGVSQARLAKMMARLRQLDPTPGLQFDQAEPVGITPDLVLQENAAGELEVELANRTGARVEFEGSYRRWRQDYGHDSATMRFLSKAEDEAVWLRRALRQRGQTLLDVGRLIVRRQFRFVDEGELHLLPLTMREVAGQLNVHESTVSRAVAHKHILTRRGVIPLRRFFSTAVASEGRGLMPFSSRSVRAHIEQLIECEALPGSMSDAAIVKELGEVGVVIARRSVAKHRMQLGLSNARDRSRWAGYRA